MSRYAKDPELNTLANELKSVPFTAAPDLDSDVQERFEILARGQGEYPFRLVYQMPNFRTWAVRLYLGGAIRTIGYTENPTHACRFADMAALRFWKYRIRGACEPLDAHLNFGIAQAKHDATHETCAILLLSRIEDYLQGHCLGDPKLLEAERVRRKFARDARRTVRHDFHELIGQLSDKLDQIEAKIDKLSGRDAPTKHPPAFESGPPMKIFGEAVVNPENLFDSNPKP